MSSAEYSDVLVVGKFPSVLVNSFNTAGTGTSSDASLSRLSSATAFSDSRSATASSESLRASDGDIIKVLSSESSTSASAVSARSSLMPQYGQKVSALATDEPHS